MKSSGQPDPATLPISAHHHPGRDPNYSTKRRHHQRNQQHQQQQQAQAQAQMQQSAPIHAAEPPRSPEYQPQFTLPSFGSASLPQGFQQYGAQLNLHQSLQVSPKNGLAGKIPIIDLEMCFVDYSFIYRIYLIANSKNVPLIHNLIV